MNDSLQSGQNRTQWTLLSTVKIQPQILNTTNTPHDDYKHHRSESGASWNSRVTYQMTKTQQATQTHPRCPRR